MYDCTVGHEAMKGKSRESPQDEGEATVPNEMLWESLDDPSLVTE